MLLSSPYILVINERFYIKTKSFSRGYWASCIA